MILLASLLLLAGPARVEHADLRSQSASSGLAATYRALASRQTAPAWIGWAVPMAGDHHRCCYGSMDALKESPCAGRCFLEDEYRNFNIVQSDGGDCVERGGAAALLVLLRVENGETQRLRTFTSDCTLDAGGLPLFWLTDARPAESVALLEGLAGDPALERKKHAHRGEPALGAIALHDDTSADAALERFVAPARPLEVRKQAVFWLGNARGRRGYEVLAALAGKEESEELRRHIPFALSQSREPEAVETMIVMARQDGSAGVRGQALFWLAQKAGKKAAATIGNAIRDDPDAEVKKRAVFALSQLPKDEGIPELIRVARTNRNPEVRKKALFWLGQSKDPRALDFMEEILTR
ncbi:MAG TPA: HEAT repeat domain-containing protein [Thermoanaerobaculia bacterium]|nr:HEAT repeat domain-containing protein [Thermoanaerobaculia bacterium]